MKKNNSNSNIVKVAVIGASAAALAAGAYFFLGPKGKKNQKHLKAWVVKMKGDVIEKMEKVGDMSEELYHSIIDSVASKYAKGKSVTQEEVSEVADGLKKHWKNFSQSVKKGSKKTVAKKVS